MRSPSAAPASRSLNHADRVKAACLAQLVNAIAPILTETGGPAWRQTIFFPFADFSNLGRGTVLRCDIDSPTYSASYYDPRGTTDLHFPLPSVPYLKAAAVHSEGDHSLTLFLLNRSLDEEMPVTVLADGFSDVTVDRATTLSHANLEAANTKETQDEVAPAPFAGISTSGGAVRLVLKPASWNIVRLRAP